MTKNVGRKDRIVRTVVAIVVAVLLYVGVFGAVGEIGWIVGAAAAAYLLVTVLLSTCLLYKLAGIDTNVEAQEYSTTDDRAGLSG